MKLTFWGTRGSVAVPGPDTLRYGGNTTSAFVSLDDGMKVIIDAGTGIRLLGNELLKQDKCLEICLLITHLHWDHINAIPFFEPLYHPGCVIRVGGWPKALAGLKRIFDSGMSDGYFPVAFSDIPGSLVECEYYRAPRFDIGVTEVRTCPLNHPQGAIAYRFRHDGKSLVFMTDNELRPGAKTPPKVAKLIRGADVLIHDAQYLPEQMKAYRGRGHSDWRTVLQMALELGVKRLVLTHHDPNRSDDQMDLLLKKCRTEAAGRIEVEAAYEGLTVEV